MALPGMVISENDALIIHPCPLPADVDTKGWRLYLYESKDPAFRHAIVGVKSKKIFSVTINPDDGDEAVMNAVEKALQKIHGV